MSSNQHNHHHHHYHRSSPTHIMDYRKNSFVIAAILIITVSMTTRTVSGQSIELSYSVEEESPEGTPVGDLVRDSNIGEYVPPGDVCDLWFSFLTQGRSDAAYLWVNSTSGQIKTAKRIDRESVCRLQNYCELNVQTAIRCGAFFMIAEIKLEIIDINDNAPAFASPSVTIEISERETIGREFMLPTASDLDRGQGHSIIGYALSESSPEFSLIQNRFPPSTFELKLRLDQRLDRENTESYSMLLEAEDGGNPRKTGTLTVNIVVVDENDNPPIFESLDYAANISEITTVGSVIMRMRARDYDSGKNGEVRYYMPLNEQADEEVYSLFSLNETSGDIKTKVPLDSFAGGVYRLFIEARDGGSTPRSAKTEVIIRIKDTHNSHPEILLQVFEAVNGVGQVSERDQLGFAIAHVEVIDPDSNLVPNGVVSCSVDSRFFQLQAMDVDQYKVILTQRLDREKEAFHSVTIFCEDSGNPPLNTTANFMVEVLDYNDNDPIFDSTLYTAEVYEGPSGSQSATSDIIVQVHASDADSGVNAQITYRFADNSDSDFGIFADGAIVVTTANGLNREDPIKGDVRELTVLAVDGGTPARTATSVVRVKVKDINDNPPRFAEPIYYFSVVEGVDPGTVVNNVTASDDDLEVNGIFYFKMAPEYQGRVPFKVGLGGSIIVNGFLDRELKAEFEFDVIAYDLGEPLSLSSTVQVHISIADINDNSPFFSFPNDLNNTLYIPHTLSPNTGFGHLIARDADDGKNGQLLYARDSGNGSKYFDIIPDTGEVVLMRALSLQDVGPHILTVAVHDLGSKKQMATQATLQIVVYEGNATLPYTDDSSGFKNVVVVVVLVVVTAVLGFAILLTIVLIRRVDKQRRLYGAKNHQDMKSETTRNFSPVVGIDLETTSPGNPSDANGDAKDSNKKKKEVSFSLDEDNNMNNIGGMTSFGSSSLDKYDAVVDSDRNKSDLVASNHFQSDRQKKSYLAPKDVGSLAFHQVHPSHSSASGKQQETAIPHEDNLSDVSGDVSTSDSGRGGSDVELQSHGGVSKDSGDTSFMSHHGVHGNHNNLNIGPGNIIGSKPSSTSSSHKLPTNAVIKSVHFSNIHPDPVLGSFRSSNSPSGQHRPIRPQRPNRQNEQLRNTHAPPPHSTSSSSSGLPPNSGAQSFSNNGSRYTPNIFTSNEDDTGSYVQLSSRGLGKDPLSMLHLDRAKSNSARFHTGQYPLHQNQNQNHNVRFNSNSSVPRSPIDGEYMDMSGARPFLPERCSSSPCVDGAWDGDTTTSGSYTVDPQELCEEIDKLFFDGVKDVVV